MVQCSGLGISCVQDKYDHTSALKAGVLFTSPTFPSPSEIEQAVKKRQFILNLCHGWVYISGEQAAPLYSMAAFQPLYIVFITAECLRCKAWIPNGFGGAAEPHINSLLMPKTSRLTAPKRENLLWKNNDKPGLKNSSLLQRVDLESMEARALSRVFKGNGINKWIALHPVAIEKSAWSRGSEQWKLLWNLPVQYIVYRFLKTSEGYDINTWSITPTREPQKALFLICSWFLLDSLSQVIQYWRSSCIRSWMLVQYYNTFLQGEK